ncbi:MAG: transferrin-binding protein-like solute binding protein [Pseudomonadota bacterium]
MSRIEQLGIEMKKSFMALGVVCALSACGGGGGGGLPFFPVGPIITSNGLSTSVEVSEAQNGEITAGPFGPITEANLSVDQNGALVRNGQVIGDEAGVVQLQHSTFGGWVDDNDAAPATIFASFGNVTPSGNLPSADATYRGESIGIVGDNDIGATRITVSEVQVDVTNGFRDVAIESRNTAFSDLNTGESGFDSAYDFTGNGQVTGSGFDATIANDFPGFDLSGTAQGKFYGPAAEEVGGVFTMSGTANSQYSGSFGGAR